MKVRVGDIVMAVNGVAVLTAKQAVRLIREASVRVTLRILRDDTVLEAQGNVCIYYCVSCYLSY